MKKAIVSILIFAMCLTFSACGGSSLSGTYVSESGIYSVEFEKNGTCTWYQDGTFFDGTYQKTTSGWQLNIIGSGFYNNTVFNAKENGKTLIITGGAVNSEAFTK